MQYKEVKIDLKVSRRESGLLQDDLAHLLGTTQPRISRLEQGKAVLTIEDVVKLTIIFGKSPVDVFRLLAVRAKRELYSQLSQMSGECTKAPNAEARQKTLSNLSNKLSDDNQNTHGEEK